MRILLISYGDYDYDGRLRSLTDVFSNMGDLYCFTRGKNPYNDHSCVYNGSYFKFIVESIKFGKSFKNVDCLVLDNRKATIPGMILKKMIKPKKVIQDCRELYLISEVSHFAGKLGCVFESIMIKHSDIIICANEDRAIFMKELYKLSDEPIVYENLRRLEYENEEAKRIAEKKFSHLMNDDEFRIISSSGCSLSRTNDILVNNFDKLEKPCRLFLVGDSTAEDEKAIKNIIKSKHLENVEILGRVNQSELKYLIQHSHIGIVNYHQKDTNNKYCASGKLFEFIYEGIPVVTTTNPPLKRLCDEEKIGVADDCYVNGINMVLDNYFQYEEAVETFASYHAVEGNNKELICSILRSLE